MIKKKNLFIGLLAYGLVLSGCSQEPAESEDVHAESVSTETTEIQSASRDIFAMDTYMTVTAYGDKAEEAIEKAVDEIQRLDSLLSATDSSGEVYAINHNSGGHLSEDSAYLIERSLELYQDTEGTFNVAVYPIMESWGFVDDNFKVPTENELQEKLELADASKIEFDSESSSINFAEEGMAIDFGGIAKGYASARIAEIYKKMGIESGAINLGGNVHLVGTKTDGSKWRVGIQSPENAQEYIGVLSAQDCAVITSGGYERYFEQDGITYHHIIDSSTGYPAENGLVSVTIVSEDGTLADALSTALFVMGKEKAEQYWENHSDQFDAILLTDEGDLYVTEGIAADFTAEQEVHIIKKDE